MASGFFALLDDIALLMDDVAMMSKVATKKTAGILGDDLAVNAEKAVGFKASRELPVLWAITKGSFLNKLIIVPAALLLSAFAAWLIEPILLAGGAFLAYEGVEKIIHHLPLVRGKGKGERVEGKGERVEAKGQEVEAKGEREKVRSAILVDFILSIEIVIIALGTVTEAELAVQALTVSVVAVLATVGVYGLVALIVRMDDAGLALMDVKNGAAVAVGRLMVRGLPVLIKVIGAVGTAALILVSGGIFVHHLKPVHEVLHAWPGWLAEVAAGLAVGLIVFGAVSLTKKALQKN
jgi:predicted DNA repair protein MutK